MTHLFLYILKSSHDPDNIECPVPYQVNDHTIFFGPCKKRLREWLYDNYLKNTGDYSLTDDEDIFVVGANGSNPQKVRQIVWAGRITRLMTFETAYNERNSLGFQKMLQEPLSPLHVQPIYDSHSEFLGYEHISKLHEDCWVSDISKRCQATGQCPPQRPKNKLCWVPDIIKSNDAPNTRLADKQLLLAPGADRHQVFSRDCCFLCDNIFFAQRTGIPITEKMLAILRKAQPGKEKEIDKYAIFGRRANKGAEGLAGRYLEMRDEIAVSFIDLIKANVPKVQGPSAAPKHKRCGSC